MSAKVTYHIGGIIDGKVFIYTALGASRSLGAALAFQRSRPHPAGNDVIVRSTPCVSRGIEYGTKVDVLSALDGSVLIPWGGA